MTRDVIASASCAAEKIAWNRMGSDFNLSKNDGQRFMEGDVVAITHDKNFLMPFDMEALKGYAGKASTGHRVGEGLAL